MNAALISIIIPVYQVEKYISECIESILSQTYKSIEIILVDDGSTDRSSIICDDYAKKHSNIQVIHKKNEGQSSARNIGIRVASGEYLMFLDSDDLLASPDILQYMITQITKTNADILTGNFCFYKNGRPGDVCHHHLQSGTYVQTPDFRFNAFYRFGHLAYVWGKLYRRDFLEKTEILFQQFSLAEDKLFNVECYLQGAVYDFIDRPVIFYRQRSYSQTSVYHPDFIPFWIRLGEEYSKLRHLCHAPKEYDDILAFHYFWGAFLLVKQELTYEKEKHPILKSINALKKYMSFPSVSYIYKELLRGKYIQTLSLSWRIMIRGVCLFLTCKAYFFFVFACSFLSKSNRHASFNNKE